MFYVVVFVSALILTLILTPQIRKLAISMGTFDEPGKRKIHNRPIPRLGGLALFAGFMVSVALAWGFLRSFGINLTPRETTSLIGILSGGLIVLLVGMLDDIRGTGVAFKFAGQIIASLVAIYFGVQIYFISTPFNSLLYLGVWAIPFTLIWMVGITNALNLIDGLDGLASGAAAIASITLFIVAVRTGQFQVAVLSLILAGCSIGFLKYNFNPASIFLGDSGSLFLGFMLACLSVVGVLKSTLVIAFIIPIFILGIPIYDTATVIISRVRARKRIFQADKRHFHHRLLRAGFSQKESVLIIYAACALLSGAALIATAFDNYQIMIVLFLIVVGAILGVDWAKDILRRSIQAPARRKK